MVSSIFLAFFYNRVFQLATNQKKYSRSCVVHLRLNIVEFSLVVSIPFYMEPYVWNFQQS